MLKQIQAVTGVVFFVFLILHLTNTWLAAAGPAVYDGVQATLRAVYQLAVVEALLLAALAVHLVVGIMRIVTEPRRTLSLRARLHRYAGFFLALVIVGHILAVRGSSWFYDVYPQFAGLAFSIEYVPAYFFPYYFLLGVAGFYHAVNGFGIAMGRLGWALPISNRALTGANMASVALMTAALLGLGGYLFDVGVPSDSEFAHLAREIFGVEPEA